jgi:hypothetical protein
MKSRLIEDLIARLQVEKRETDRPPATGENAQTQSHSQGLIPLAYRSTATSRFINILFEA